MVIKLVAVHFVSARDLSRFKDWGKSTHLFVRINAKGRYTIYQEEGKETEHLDAIASAAFSANLPASVQFPAWRISTARDASESAASAKAFALSN